MNLQTLYEVKCVQHKMGKSLRTLPTIQVLRPSA